MPTKTDWQVGVANQITTTFLKKGQKLKTKNERKNPRFLVVEQITNNDFKKEFIIVIAKTANEWSKNIDLNNEILWKSITRSMMLTKRWLDFSDVFTLIERDGKYFIKQQNQEYPVNIQQYHNDNGYDLNDSVLKDKISKIKLLINNQTNKPHIVEQQLVTSNISKNVKLPAADNDITKLNNEYKELKNKKLYFQDMSLKYDNSKSESLELLKKQWNNTQIQRINFTEQTNKKLHSILTNSRNWNNAEIELEVEFKTSNNDTYIFKLESQQFTIVNCKLLTQNYYSAIKTKFEKLSWMIDTVTTYEKKINNELNSFNDHLEELKAIKKILEAKRINFSESCHRKINNEISNLLYSINSYNESITNLKKESNLCKLLENKDFLAAAAKFFNKYQGIKKNKTTELYFSDYKFFDNDLENIGLEFFKIIGNKKFNFEKSFDLNKDFGKWDLITVPVKKIKTTGFMEKVGSFINKILITLKLKKPAKIVTDNQEKINKIIKTIELMNEETNISQDSLNPTNQETNQERTNAQELLFQTPTLTSDLNFWLNNTDPCWSVKEEPLIFEEHHFDQNQIIECEQTVNKEALKSLSTDYECSVKEEPLIFEEHNFDQNQIIECEQTVNKEALKSLSVILKDSQTLL